MIPFIDKWLDDDYLSDCILCLSCGAPIILPEWYGKNNWFEGCVAIDYCACQYGMPVIRKGDLLVDKNYDIIVACLFEKYRSWNLMSITRPGDWYSETIYHRKCLSAGELKEKLLVPITQLAHFYANDTEAMREKAHLAQRIGMLIDDIIRSAFREGSDIAGAGLEPASSDYETDKETNSSTPQRK